MNEKESAWLKETIRQGHEDELVIRAPLSPESQDLFDKMKARIESKYEKDPDHIFFGSRAFPANCIQEAILIRDVAPLIIESVRWDIEPNGEDT